MLFGDDMAQPAWNNAEQAVQECDLLISVGTSQTVYPAAILPDQARDQGAKVITIDPTVGAGDVWLGKAADILPKLVAAVLE